MVPAREKQATSMTMALVFGSTAALVIMAWCTPRICDNVGWAVWQNSSLVGKEKKKSKFVCNLLHCYHFLVGVVQQDLACDYPPLSATVHRYLQCSLFLHRNEYRPYHMHTFFILALARKVVCSCLGGCLLRLVSYTSIERWYVNEILHCAVIPWLLSLIVSLLLFFSFPHALSASFTLSSLLNSTLFFSPHRSLSSRPPAKPLLTQVLLGRISCRRV